MAQDRRHQHKQLFAFIFSKSINTCAPSFVCIAYAHVRMIAVCVCLCVYRSQYCTLDTDVLYANKQAIKYIIQACKS